MFSKLYKFSKFVMYLNSCSMDLGRDIKSKVERCKHNITPRRVIEEETEELGEKPLRDSPSRN